MNKAEMAQKLAGQTGLTNQKALEVLESIFSTDAGAGIIAIELDAGRDVAIAGFGKFETKRRSARMGRNPQTGAAIEIAARTVATFKPAKGLKDRVSI